MERTMIRWADRRVSIKDFIKQFSDKNYQETVWKCPHKYSINESGSLDKCIAEIFDLSPFDNPESIDSSEGYLLYKNELSLAKEFSSLALSIIDNLGDVDLVYYLSHPQWSQLREYAGALLSAMDRNDDNIIVE